MLFRSHPLEVFNTFLTGVGSFSIVDTGRDMTGKGNSDASCLIGGSEKRVARKPAVHFYEVKAFALDPLYRGPRFAFGLHPINERGFGTTWSIDLLANKDARTGQSPISHKLSPTIDLGD